MLIFERHCILRIEEVGIIANWNDDNDNDMNRVLVKQKVVIPTFLHKWLLASGVSSAI